MSDLLTPAQVAGWLNVDRAWVYEHADELAAMRLGTGPKARLRFDRETVEEWMNSCSTGRASSDPEPAAKQAIRRRRPAASAGTNLVLLPIRGQNRPLERARAA